MWSQGAAEGTSASSWDDPPAVDPDAFAGWVVDVQEDGRGGWWCLVTLVGSFEVPLVEGPYPTAEAALTVGHKVAYDAWQAYVE